MPEEFIGSYRVNINHILDRKSFKYFQLSSVQLLSHVWLFEISWIAARQASLFITNSKSSPKPMSIESVIPSSHLILFHPLLLLPSIIPSIRVFSNESALRVRWPKYWSFSFNISPSVLPSFDPSYFPMAHLLKPSHWRWGFQHMNFGMTQIFSSYHQIQS